MHPSPHILHVAGNGRTVPRATCPYRPRDFGRPCIQYAPCGCRLSTTEDPYERDGESCPRHLRESHLWIPADHFHPEWVDPLRLAIPGTGCLLAQRKLVIQGLDGKAFAPPRGEYEIEGWRKLATGHIVVQVPAEPREQLRACSA